MRHRIFWRGFQLLLGVAGAACVITGAGLFLCPATGSLSVA